MSTQIAESRTFKADPVSHAYSWVTGRGLGRFIAELPKIERFEEQFKTKSDRELRKYSLGLRHRAKSGESLARLLPEAFALVREAGRRTIHMRHYDVQLIGGMIMFNGAIAEMETGEGKTLTATLPMYLYALPGNGAHLATVNDYLAKRDAEIMAPLYEMLGMSIGVVEGQMPSDARRKAYACDITYGTSKEFGFDFLRDRLLIRQTREQGLGVLGTLMSKEEEQNELPVQRGAYYCLVDEADSVLIDDARTPLIISSIPGEAEERAVACYRWAADMAKEFAEDDEYEYDHDRKSVELTIEGRLLVRRLTKPPELDPVGLVDLYDYIERAIKVARDFHFNQHYVINDGEIVIVDESTGRLAEGRKWSGGIHQAIEAKEEIEVTVATGQAARITVQDMFIRYPHLGGMTGTASTSAAEFKKIYKINVIRCPTNRKVQRKLWSDRVFGTEEAKWEAIIEEIRELHAIGRPILIGTRTIEKSEHLAKLLEAEGIAHEVLNARHVAIEAEIVARAGAPGKVTVATNMAGRGTDIKLSQEIKDLGGLHVICTELHDSARIDRQLVGRCGRQGDPGSVRQYMSLDDDCLRIGYGPIRAKKLAAIGEKATSELNSYASLFRKAQRKIERKHFGDRKVLLYHEKMRKKMHREMGQDPYLDSPD
ncbi:preprotein translocase subunit SecA [Blastopirellula sp. J2-11]|uniref:preprotein translocase subunit SecA n=1 Tax=Blastopirellula sp. J2-11 TaxID=2943192 RepID=UPI0021C56D48|nr:preprotein translocase subunit SecA [Blastopirellula sp. J2-11]UUO08807.1 preprotein translocase subunit SecA [Blastopirellula sp. J2-11]